MKLRRNHPQSATSLEQSPQDDETARMKQYVITMLIRTVCVVLAFAVQPWGWHTALFGVGAVFLPYIAVVLANQAHARASSGAERPEIALDAPKPEQEPDVAPRVIRLAETHGDEHTDRGTP
ncbi:DUF3099 domain-containing protein [Microbacterium karelineae]|uniref:DUF3099 domain-containing protein n=1 Tax=Microbacterium karelineae TaxID=2654283 RepID=UPI0012EA030E|nr:DUF3099 domain-containing protein [Microbacterium karelineae]